MQQNTKPTSKKRKTKQNPQILHSLITKKPNQTKQNIRKNLGFGFAPNIKRVDSGRQNTG
jgi:predicted transcriptional regulator